MPDHRPSSRLHRKIASPYYIMAPDYKESSAGIQCLHYLCHALNLEGAQAYMAGCQSTSAALHTPLLTQEVQDRHARQGVAAIAVYPEIVTGNPLSAPVSVRYMLNKEGVLNGNRIDAGSDDLRFYFREEFRDPAAPGDILRLPMIDIDLFSPDPAQPPTLDLLYLHRIPREAVDFARLPPGVQVLSMEKPLSLAELAQVLRKARVLYSYEKSATCSLAVFSGCPVVALTAPGYERYANTPQTLADLGGGIVWNDDEASLALARSQVPVVRELYLGMEQNFWQQLQVFIAKTQDQAAARRGSLETPANLLRDWLERRSPAPPLRRAIDARLALRPQAASLCVLVRDPGGSLESLRTTLQSLAAPAQVLPPAAVHVLSPLPESALQALRAPGLVLHAGTAPQAFADAANRIASAARQAWLLAVDAGAAFTPAGLAAAALALQDAPDDLRALYGDELIRLQDSGLGPVLRPDFNLDMLLSCPAGLARHWMVRRSVFDGAGGLDPALGAAAEFDLLLRLVERGGLAGLAHASEPWLVAPAPALATEPAQIAAIERHLRGRGYDAATVEAPLPGRYRIRYGHADRPLVSVVIAAGHQLAALQRCVETLLEKTDYAPYELLVCRDSGMAEEVDRWLDGLASLGSDRIRVLDRVADAPRGLAALRNRGAAAARGDYLLFLDAATAVVRGDWLDALLNHAQRPEVGIAGAKLLLPDGRVRHAGLVLGLDGPAGPAFAGEPADAAGYMHRLEIDQDYSAVSGDCLMVRRSVHAEVGGFDEDAFHGGYADVDLCLKVRQAGYLAVWTPHAVLLHDGTAAPPASEADERAAADALLARWLPLIARDPAYNAHLSLRAPGFEPDTGGRIDWARLMDARLPRILAFSADDMGCGHYRMLQPGRAIEAAALASVEFRDRYPSPVEIERLAPDAIVLQRQIGDEQIAALPRMVQFRQAFKVAELDDYLPNLPRKSAHRDRMPRDILRSLRRAVAPVDRFVVSTPALAEAFAELHPQIRVVENRLPVDWWSGLAARRRRSPKPRVGWAGGVSHQGDLELLADVVKELADEVEWVFFGMCPDALRPHVHEFHGGQPIAQYPAALAALDLDLALAPLEHNLFNECKSNLRLLEYGACGFPVVCTDIGPYRGTLPVTRVKNRFKDWVDAIRMHTADLDAAARAGDALREAVLRDWMLEGDALRRWLAAWLPD